MKLRTGALAALCCTALAGGVRAQDPGVRDNIESSTLPSFRETRPQPLDMREPSALSDFQAQPGPRPTGTSGNFLFRQGLNPFTHDLRNMEPVHDQEEGIRSSVTINVPDTFSNFTFLRHGFEPQFADLKLGPLFLNFPEASTSIIVSDNINLSENNREAGVIAIAQLQIQAILQLTEGLQFVASGSLIYFPLQNEIGFGGFGLATPFSLGLAAVPGAVAQLAGDLRIGNWPITLSDTFSAQVGHFNVGSRDDFQLFEGVGFDGEDRAGRYTFRAPPARERRDFTSPDLDERDTDFIFFRNSISVTTERLFPGEIHLRASAYHENLFYNQGRRGLPNLREGAFVDLRDERKDLRFKPYASYEALRTSEDRSFDHTLRLGLEGPLTDNITVRAEAGYYFDQERGLSRGLYELEINHIAGPYTRESVVAGRNLTYFHDLLETYAYYNLRQVLGPRLYGVFYFGWFSDEDLEGELARQDAIRTGIRLTATLGPRTRLSVSGQYAHLYGSESSDTYTGRADLLYRFSDTLSGSLLYQYQRHDASDFGRTYYENLVFLSVTKRFH